MASRYNILIGNVITDEACWYIPNPQSIEAQLCERARRYDILTGDEDYRYIQQGRNIEATLVVGSRRSGKTTRLIQNLEEVLESDRNARVLFLSHNLGAAKNALRDIDIGRNRIIACGPRNIAVSVRGRDVDAFYIDEIRYCRRSEATTIIQALRQYLNSVMPCQNLQRIMMTCDASDEDILMSSAESLDSGRFRIAGLEWSVDHLHGHVPGNLG